jgi:hypothetical protein
VQTIATRSDIGHDIDDGWFMLGFNHGGKTTLDPEDHVVTSRIPFDATAQQVKDALEALSNIGPGGLLRVERNQGKPVSWRYRIYERWLIFFFFYVLFLFFYFEATASSELFETGSKAQILQAGMGASSSSSSSSYRWTVVFDSARGSLSGDLPLLVVVGEGISAAWTGGGLQVNVVEVVKGGREEGEGPGLPKTAAAAAVPLVFTAHGLTPYTKYRFRVRAVSTNGVSTNGVSTNGGVSSFSSFSDWSPPSRPLGTKATVRPWLVRPPSSTTNVILLTGNGRETANTMDPSFSFGAGRGGKGLQPVSGKFYAGT